MRRLSGSSACARKSGTPLLLLCCALLCALPFLPLVDAPNQLAMRPMTPCNSIASLLCCEQGLALCIKPVFVSSTIPLMLFCWHFKSSRGTSGSIQCVPGTMVCKDQCMLCPGLLPPHKRYSRGYFSAGSSLSSIPSKPWSLCLIQRMRPQAHLVDAILCSRLWGCPEHWLAHRPAQGTRDTVSAMRSPMCATAI